MKYSNVWAAPASIAVLTSFALAVHDAAYRPAFVQVATITLMATPKQDASLDEKRENLRDEEGVANNKHLSLKPHSSDDSKPR